MISKCSENEVARAADLGKRQRSFGSVVFNQLYSNQARGDPHVYLHQAHETHILCVMLCEQ